MRDLLGERAVDIVVDPVGGDRMTDSLRSLGPQGRLLVVGFTAGEIPTVKVNRLLLGNTGVWRAGKLRDLPVRPYPFEDARGALRAIADRHATGKVVLSKPAVPDVIGPR